MKRVSVIATALVLALLAVFTYDVAAQQPDTRDRTIMTFSNAVELPGMKLEPGTYVFRLADTAGRNVIQVLPQDGTEMLGQWLFIPAERQEATSDTVVTFRETSANSTPAVQFWYYPGEKTGKEFIYPKDQAMRIAQRTGATVMTEDGPVSTGGQQTASAPAEPAATAPQADAEPKPEPEAVAAERDDQGVVAGAGVPESQERPVGTSGRADAQEPAPQATASAQPAAELPQTASPLALSGWLALMSLAGAAGIRLFRS